MLSEAGYLSKCGGLVNICVKILSASQKKEGLKINCGLKIDLHVRSSKALLVIDLPRKLWCILNTSRSVCV